MKSRILDGVPKVGFHKHCSPFLGSLFSVLTYLGDTPDYNYLMGVSGAAFRRFWERDDGGNVDVMYLAPQPQQRAFRATGWTCETLRATDEATLRTAIVESINAGKPVLACGIIGPPEVGIVAGYEDDGAVLRGWSYFQDASIEGYYRQPDWFDHAEWAGGPGGLALIVIGERTPRPSDREIVISSLDWIVDLAHTTPRPEVPGHVSGLAAYTGWADGVLVDADYPIDNPKVLSWRLMVHGDQCSMLGERENGAAFLRWGASVLPEAASDLCEAAGHYDAVAALMPRIWPWGYEMTDKEARALADPQLRPGISAAIREARDNEARGVDRVEAALAKVTG